MLVVNEIEEGVVVLQRYPLGLQKPVLDWSWYQDVNPVPTRPLADDLAITLSGRLAVSQQNRLIVCFDSSQYVEFS